MTGRAVQLEPLDPRRPQSGRSAAVGRGLGPRVTRYRLRAMIPSDLDAHARGRRSRLLRTIGLGRVTRPEEPRTREGLAMGRIAGGDGRGYPGERRRRDPGGRGCDRTPTKGCPASRDSLPAREHDARGKEEGSARLGTRRTSRTSTRPTPPRGADRPRCPGPYRALRTIGPSRPVSPDRPSGPPVRVSVLPLRSS